MPDDSLRSIVLIGPESTGKTTLAATLARALDTAWSPEFAREYAATHRELSASTVEPIARGELGSLDRARAEAIARGRDVVVHDTDLVSTVVYARHYYGTCPAWIVEAATARRGDLYLLCAPDVPWVADGIRDRPTTGADLFADFRAFLDALGARVVELRGDFAHRTAQALRVVVA